MAEESEIMKKILLLFGLLPLFLFTACAPSAVYSETWAYDTYCTAKVWGGTDTELVFRAAAAEGQRLLTEDGAKDFFASRDGEFLAVGEDLYRILTQAEFLYHATEGVFDLSVAPLSRLWDVTHAEKPPSAEAIEQALSLVGWDALSLTDEGVTFSQKGMGIDIGSVGKGYGADQTVRALKEAGAEGGVVSFGGNVAVFGTKNGDLFRVGIKDPQDVQRTLGILTVTDVSVVTTGAYERNFEYEGVTYHHLLDPKTGLPRESDLLSVTVVCRDGAQADMVATALWLMGTEKGWGLYETLCTTEGFLPCEVIFVRKDGTVEISDGLGSVFTLTAEEYRMWENH